MQPLAPQAFPTAGQAPAPALAGNALDGSSVPWRKEAGGATAAGPAGEAVAPAVKPRAQFTMLLESLVSADPPAFKKEAGPRTAFWMAIATATPQVSPPAKPAESAAETGDGAHTDDSLAAGRAATPETSGGAAGPRVQVAPQSGAALPAGISTPMRPDAPEDRAELPQAAAQAVENGAPDSKPAAVAASAGQETADGTAAGAEAKFGQTAGDRSTASGAQDSNEVAAVRETSGEAAAVSQRFRNAAQAGPETKLQQAVGTRSAAGDRQDGNKAAAVGERTGEVAAVSQRVRGVAQAGTEVKLPQADSARSVAKASPGTPRARTGGTENRQGAAPEQEALQGRSDGLQVSSTASMVPAQTPLPAAGLPADPRPEADGPSRWWREGRSPSPGATGRNGAANAGTAGGQPLAAPAVAEQTAAQSQPDANTEESGDKTGRPDANSAAAALEPQDDAIDNSAARPMVVAFTARLRPVEAAPETPGGGPATAVAEPIGTAPGGMEPAGQEDWHDIQAASTMQPAVSREPVRKSEVSAAGASEPAVTAPPATAQQPPAASGARPRESAPDSPPPAAATEPPVAPVAPRPAAAHDIQLQLAGQGDQKVEVRVSERAGDMRVEVRTPDSGLAGNLREDLPALASRLEQTGFRAETWHPAGTAEHQGTAQAAPGGASQNSARQPGQNGGQRQRDSQPQPKPKAQENDTPAQEPGKDFAWLFSSIQ